jgi:cell division protein FtsI (penicillin-binding protein 3)
MRPSDVIDCEQGVYVPHPTMKPIRDVHPYGVLTLTQVIEKSSNIGMLKAATAHFSLADLREYVQRFRLDATTGIDLPFERYGQATSLSDRSGYALYYVPWGQGIAVTPLQMLTVVNTIANGGMLVQPRVVREILGPGEHERERLPVVELGQIISAEAARQATKMMVAVVETGTGQTAQVEGIRVAGKTGTSQKADPSGAGYLDDAYVSSFIGFFPAEDPVYSMLTLINEPQGGHYGGQVAGPVFRRIAEELVRYEQMQPVIRRVTHLQEREPVAGDSVASSAGDVEVDAL